MSQMLTSNQLTRIYGDSPYKQGNGIFLRRGVVIYINLTLNGISGRVYYQNFEKEQDNLETHKSLEKIITEIEIQREIGNNTDADQMLFDNKIEIVDTTINSIDFGWTPCHVSYILHKGWGKFLNSANIDNSEVDFPSIIFRRDKIILQDSPSSVNGVKAVVEEYVANHSFCDLQFDPPEDPTIMRFRNEMRVNKEGDYLGKQPQDATEAARKYYKHCIDIPIALDLSSLIQNFGGAIPADNRPSTKGSVSEKIIVVFDPPQGNGGGSGLPTYP